MRKREVISLVVKPLIIILASVIAIPSLFVIAVYVSNRKERTAELHLNDKTDIHFTVNWGWDMHQSVSIYTENAKIAKAGEVVFKKPYNLGGPLYFDELFDIYYLALYFGVYEINIKKGFIKNICFIKKDVFERLSYVGYFGLRDYDRTHDDDVAFMPAGKKLSPLYQGEDVGRTISGRCG